MAQLRGFPTGDSPVPFHVLQHHLLLDWLEAALADVSGGLAQPPVGGGR